jgi:hypothetical protein
MEPAQSIIRALGGPTVVSGILNIHRTRVSSWQRSREAGGTGGSVPQRYHRILLDHADANGIALSADDFLSPRLAEAAQ